MTNQNENKIRKLFTSRTLAALVLFVVANIFIFGQFANHDKELTVQILTDNPNEKRQEGRWVWWVSRNYLKDHPDAEVALMGSSQMSSAVYSAECNYLNKDVDCVTDKKSEKLSDMLGSRLGVNPKTYVFAMGGAMASDHYLLAKSLFTKKHKPKLVVVGLNPRDFIDNTMSSVSSTEPFYFLAPYVNLGELANCAFKDPIERLEWAINDHLPIMATGRIIKEAIPKLSKNLSNLVALSLTGKEIPDAVEEKVTEKPNNIAQKEEKTTVDILNAVYGKQSEVKPGTWVLPPQKSYAFLNNMHEYERRYKDPYPATYTPQKKFFKAFLKHLKDENIEVLVLGMPSLWPNRELLPDQFWSDFRNFISSSCSEYGATFVDLSNKDKRFNNRCYLDTVHLNQKGGAKLLEDIANQITKSKRLAQSLKQSDSQKSIADRKQSWH